MQLKHEQQEVFPIAQYIPFTEEQKLRAGAVDLEEFLRMRGERLIRSGRDKRLESDHSVTVRGSEWYDHAAERGGGPVSFLQRFYRMSYPEAMQTLLGGDCGRAYPIAREREPEQPKEFILPEANLNMRRVFAYLIKQQDFLQQLLGIERVRLRVVILVALLDHGVEG